MIALDTLPAEVREAFAALQTANACLENTVLLKQVSVLTIDTFLLN